jgi:hypothetical protein
MYFSLKLLTCEDARGLTVVTHSRRDPYRCTDNATIISWKKKSIVGGGGGLSVLIDEYREGY